MFDVVQLPGTSDDRAVFSSLHTVKNCMAADCFNCSAGQLLLFKESIFSLPFPLVLSPCQNLKIKSTKDCKDQSAKNSLESEY